ncbi:MAG: glycosyl hydrolase family 28 protein [Phycisphaerae bacterium]
MSRRTIVLAAWTVLAAAAAAGAGEAAVFNVREYGATGDRSALDTAAMQRAVDACHNAGGGTVLVPAGDYLSATVRLKDGVTLRLAKGATLWITPEKAHYDGTRHLLTAEDATAVTVEGEGEINGQATGDYGGRWGRPKRPAFRTGVLLFHRCRDVAVRGITIRHSDSWTLHFKRCTHVTVEDVTIRNNYRRLNSDGIDPNMCRHVRIRRCDIVAGDDCVVLKATEAAACEDVVVTDCVLESAASAIKLGTESHGDFRNIRFAGCTIRNSFTGIGFYLKDGGTMEHVRFENIRIETCPETVRTVTPIFMDIERRHKDSKVGTIRDVTFEDIAIRSGSGVLIQGMPESPIRDLTLKDVRFRVDKPDDYRKRHKPVGGRRTVRGQRDTEFARLPAYVTLAHVTGLRVEDLAVRVPEAAMKQYDRSALCGRFLEGARLRGVRREPGPEAGERPVVDLRDCTAVQVLDGS